MITAPAPSPVHDRAGDLRRPCAGVVVQATVCMTPRCPATSGQPGDALVCASCGAPLTQIGVAR